LSNHIGSFEYSQQSEWSLTLSRIFAAALALLAFQRVVILLAS
jgi:hypothetical protein